MNAALSASAEMGALQEVAAAASHCFGAGVFFDKSQGVYSDQTWQCL